MPGVLPPTGGCHPGRWILPRLESTLRFDVGYKQGHVSHLGLLLKMASLQLRKRTGHFKNQRCAGHKAELR
jgi:hypothetical protein